MMVELVDLNYIIYGCMAILIIYLWTRKSYSTRSPVVLTPSEVHDLLTTWKPAPLVSPEQLTPKRKHILENIPCVSSTHNEIIKFENDDREYINFGSYNFFGFGSGHEKIQGAALEKLHECGVGACGPRNFYGTVDIHLDFEREYAEFLGYESGILYASGLATVASVIPAFADRADFIVCDERVKLSIQIGNASSRATVKYFRHGDMNHLEELLEQIHTPLKKANKTKKVRCFIITEGVFQYTGTIAPLPVIVALAKKYGFRVILDDTFGVGILGATGRGSLEYHHLKPTDVTLHCSDISYGLSSFGGICCGNRSNVRFQRLNGSGYMFSASNPPFLVSSALEALKELDSNPGLIGTLQAKSRLLHEAFGKVKELLCEGDPLTPFAIVRVRDQVLPECDGDDEELFISVVMEKIVARTKERGFVITQGKYTPTEKFPVAPHLRVSLMVLHTDDQVRALVEAVHQSVLETLGEYQ